MTLDFDNHEQYQNFVDDVANCILADFQFTDELHEDIAGVIIEKFDSNLAEAILDRLLEMKLHEKNSSKG